MRMEINNQDGEEELPELIGMILEIGNSVKINLIQISLNHQECSDMEMTYIYWEELTQVVNLKTINSGNIHSQIGFTIYLISVGTLLEITESHFGSSTLIL